MVDRGEGSLCRLVLGSRIAQATGEYDWAWPLWATLAGTSGYGGTKSRGVRGVQFVAGRLLQPFCRRQLQTKRGFDTGEFMLRPRALRWALTPSARY